MRKSKKHRRLFATLGGLLFLFSGNALALDTLAMLEAGPSKTLLEGKKPIHAETRGRVPIPFGQALKALEQPGLLQNVQDAYCKLIAEGGTPEFTIQQTSSNTYYYVNRKDERTDIAEVVRSQTTETSFDIVLYSTGQRFFGHYEAVIHVRVEAAGDAASRYTALVYAYPESAVSRFFARHLGLVERYFDKKTRHMTEIVTTLARRLCAAGNRD